MQSKNIQYRIDHSIASPLHNMWVTNTSMLSFRSHFVYLSALPVSRPAGGATNTISTDNNDESKRNMGRIFVYFLELYPEVVK